MDATTLILGALALIVLLLGILGWSDGILIGAAVLIPLVALSAFLGRRVQNEKRAGTYAARFVYVEDDGQARELTPDERDLLNAEFRPASAARPRIKRSYDVSTPDGRLGGFLARHKVPAHVSIRARAGDE